ncbi:MAG: tetratricopeptide repeat protein [Gammaproteobacteria bacterium]|nr:tetratricopeptide repeat protein [Gammaproteobacteria bacterium]
MIMNFHYKKLLSLLVVMFLIQLLTACGGADDRKANYFKRGMELFEQGNYVKAELEFKNVLQIDPKDAEAHFMFGQIMEKEENWRKAYALFLRSVELNPNHVGALTHLGRLYAMSGSPEKALDVADRALVQKPGDPAAMVLKGLAKARMGNKEDAVRDVEAAVKVDPKNVDAVSLLSALHADLGDLDRAIGLARQGLEENPEHMGLHLLLARMYEKTANTRGTVEILEKMIALQPDNQSNRTRLAAYHHAKGNKAEAEKVLRDAVATKPDSIDAKLALVEYLSEEKSTLENAEQELRQFVKQNPQEYRLQFALAKIYLGLGRRDEAKKIYQDISEKEVEGVDGAQARTKLAGLLMLDKELDKSKEMIDGVLADDPKNKDALLTRAALSLAMNDAGKGIADLRTLLGEDPGHVKGLRLKARAHLANKEVALARESLEAAIQASPQEAAANFELAQLLVQTGKEDDAIAVLQKMQKFAPDHTGIVLGIAKIYSRQKKWGKVISIAKQMQSKHPDQAPGYYYEGLGLQGMGKLEESTSLFDQALKFAPNAVEPLIAIAKSWLVLKQPDKALRRVQQVIQQNEKNFLAYNLEGQIYASQERFKEAWVAFKKAGEINPKWPVPYSSQAKLSLIEKDIPGAISLLKQGLEKTNALSLAMELAAIYERNGKESEARVLYQRVLKERPNVPVVKNNLAMLLLYGKPDQAALDKALELTKEFAISESPVYVDTLGWVYYMRGEFADAVTMLERADRGGLKLPDISYHLGMAYYKLGRNKEAMEKLEQALKSEKSFTGIEEARRVLGELKAK